MDTSPKSAALDLTEILRAAQTVVVMGCSGDPFTTSHRISKYMQEVGYRIVPINPNYDEILGEPCYPDLAHMPADVQVDLVNIFRQPRFTAEMVQQVVDLIDETGERPVIWTQLGVSSREARTLAATHGLPYVENRCIMVEHARRLG